MHFKYLFLQLPLCTLLWIALYYVLLETIHFFDQVDLNLPKFYRSSRRNNARILTCVTKYQCTEATILSCETLCS